MKRPWTRAEVKRDEGEKSDATLSELEEIIV